MLKVPGPARRDHRPQRHRAGRLRAGRRHRRHAVPDQGAADASPAASRRCSTRRRASCWRSSSRRAASSTSRATCPARSRRRSRSSTSPGCSSSRARGASTRASGWPRRCSAGSAPTARASPGWSTRRTTSCAARDGERRIVKDALGEPIVLQETKRAEPGKDLRLTLDAELQGKVENVLAEVGLAWRPKGATALVMDPYSNTILALANWPRVDANDRGGAPEYAAQNRAVGFNYEPGSTFKPFTVAGALRGEGRHARPTSSTCRRRSTSPTARSRRRTTAAPSTSRRREILAQSSNVGTVRIGQRLGATRFDRWVRRFGFGRTTGIELPGEETGQVLKRRRVLRLVDGQPADRPGRVGHADAARDGLLGDRQRRDPAPAADHLRDRRRARPRCRAASA